MENGAAKNNPSFTPTRSLILMFLLLSGSCGLVYEILWMKMLTLVIGNTVFSITTVLTAFMGGLALGSFLAGRFIDQIKDPLRTYAILEGGIGAYALLLPLFIAGTEPLFRIIYQGIHPSFYTFSLLRFVVCGIILLFPTTLMGATLPVLSKYFVERQSHVGWNVGMLYGVNTFGAVLGSFAAGFVLIPTLGITWTIYLAALLNLSICAGVLKLAKNRVRWEPSGSDEKSRDKKQKEKSAEEVVPEGWGTIQWVVAAGIGVSGMAAMIYQIAWTRVLLLSIGSSVYAFSLIVTAFICGLALGSLVIAKFIDRRRDLVLWLALMQGAIGLSALLIVPLLGKLPVFVANTIFTSSRSFQYVHFAEFAVIFGLILIPTFMMGAAVPMAIKSCTPDVRHVGRFFGNVYAVNTVGAIIGSFVAGFLLIPWLGTQKSILIAVTLNLGAGGILFLHAPSYSRPRRLAGALAALVVALSAWSFTSSWDPFILTSGTYLYTDRYKETAAKQSLDVEGAVKGGRQKLFFKEGFHGVVSVEKTAEGDLALRVNGKTDATAKGDAATQLMVGHLPLLLQQAAKDVLVIGLGSGMTVGAVERYPVKAIDVVEIEPAVVEASRYFREHTGDAVNDPRVNLILADGRNHLALTGKTYDVIISEPSNPWVAGMANLFTREFFQLAKDRLRKRGLMCQWAHAYSMSSDDFKTIVRTFHAVFPHVTVWAADLDLDYVLIGSSDRLDVDYEMLRNRLTDERLRADMRTMDTRDPAAFFNKLIITEEAIPRYTQGAPLHTDDNALLAYSAPKALLEGRSTRLFEELYHHGPNPVSMLRSLQWFEIPRSMENDLLEKFEAAKEVRGGYISYAKGALRDAVKRFENALAISPGDYDAAYLLAKLNYDMGRHFKGAERPVEATGAYERSLKAIDGFIGGDRALLSDHFKLDVIHAKANFERGVIALKADRLNQAAEAFKKSLSGAVHYAEAHNNLGFVYARMAEYDAAVNQYQLAIELDPTYVSARMNMGNALFRQGKYGEAVEIYLQVQELMPGSALTHYNLGLAYFRQNQWAKAESEWRRALALKPGYPEAQRGLDVVRDKARQQGSDPKST
jgi:spermidine synthase